MNLISFTDKGLYCAQGEFYITDLLSIAVEEGQVTSSIGMKSWQETLGINTPEQLAEAEKWV